MSVLGGLMKGRRQQDIADELGISPSAVSQRVRAEGIGWGRVQVLSEEPRVEDGPGWWAARAAIETVEGYERKAPLRAVRTAYVAAEGEQGPEPALVNAALMSRDVVVTGLSERSMSVLDGLMKGRRQQDIADELGISPSAVSQRVRAEGLGVVLASDELLRHI